MTISIAAGSIAAGSIAAGSIAAASTAVGPSAATASYAETASAPQTPATVSGPFSPSSPFASKFASPAVEAGYIERRDSVISAHYTYPIPALTGCDDHRGYLNWATAALWLGLSTVEANLKLATVRISHVIGQNCDHGLDPSRANLWLSNLVRPYYLYYSGSSFLPGRLTAAAQNNLIAQMWAYAAPYSQRSQAKDSWSIYDSENHDAQAESFDFLAAQAFLNNPDYKNRKYADGSTVAQQYQAWHDHWSSYLDERAKKGLFIEVGSPKYHGYTLDAILNVYDFASDPILRQKAAMVLDLDFADYAQQELNGIWGGAKSRSFPADSVTGADDAMTSDGSLLFGPDQDVRPKYVLALATSGYYPPPVVEALATDPVNRGSFSYVTRRPGIGHPGWDENKDWHVSTTQSIVNYAYVTPDYVMGTAELDPTETDIAPSSQNRWLGIIFGTGPEDRVYPQAAPSDDTKTGDAFYSVQSKNVLITRKHSYGSEPTQVYFANTLDTLSEQSGWVFVKEGNAYLAVRPMNGSYHWLTGAKNKASKPSQRFIRLTSSTSPIIFEAGRVANYPTFAAFKATIIHNPRSFKGGVAQYTSEDGTKLTLFQDARPPRVNGVPISFEPAAVYNSPYMHSVWNSGKVTMTMDGQSASYDFSNKLHPLKIVR